LHNIGPRNFIKRAAAAGLTLGGGLGGPRGRTLARADSEKYQRLVRELNIRTN
jgi:hypothetical protein